MPQRTTTCLDCGDPLEVGRPGRQPQRCSQCRVLENRRRARRHERRKLDERRQERIKAVYTCLWCESIFTITKVVGRTQKYCQDACAAKASDARRATRRLSARRSLPVLMCDQCGEAFSQRFLSGPTPKYCGPACIQRASNEQHVQTKRRLRQRKRCCYCDGPMPQFRRTHCGSEDCSRENKLGHAHRRRAWKLALPAETFTRQDVFERDQWMCGICDTAVDPKLNHPDPLSASLDHIQPLSLGGHHVRSNARLAHLICNVRRSNRAA